MHVGVCRPAAGPRRWLDENCSSGGEDGGDNVTAARLLSAEELVPGMRIVKALTKQDLHTGQARARPHVPPDCEELSLASQEKQNHGKFQKSTVPCPCLHK